MKKVLIALLFMVIAVTVFATTTYATSRYMVTADYLRVRDEPGGEVFYKLKYGTVVDVINIKKGWAKILYDFGSGYGESYGYVWSEYLTNVEPVKVDEKSDFALQEGNAVVGQNAYKWLNVRQKMSKKSSRLAKLVPGDQINVLEVSGDWAKIEASNGKIGYVMLEFIHLNCDCYCYN